MKEYIDSLTISKNQREEYLKNVRKNKDKKRRLLQKINRLSKEFITYLHSQSRVIDFTQREEYNELNRGYMQIKGSYELSDTDWDLLISGVIASRELDLVGILTNDFGIIKAWKLLLDCEICDVQSLQFYFRVKQREYVMAEAGRDHQIISYPK